MRYQWNPTWRFVIIVAVAMFTLGVVIGTNTAEPRCLEDEAVWWVDQNVRGCVHWEQVSPLSRR